MSSLKDRVQEALSKSGKKQADLAKACGVSAPSVNDWLSGKTKSLKATTAQRASAFLGVNMLWLTEGRGPMRPHESSAHAPHAEEPETAYGPQVTDEEVELLRDLRELLRDRWDHYATEIRKEADVARAYKAMGISNPDPVRDEDVAKHLPSAPTVKPVERRHAGRRATDYPPEHIDTDFPMGKWTVRELDLKSDADHKHKKRGAK